MLGTLEQALQRARIIADSCVDRHAFDLQKYKIHAWWSPAQLLQLGTGSLAAGQESINHLAITYGQLDDTINNVLQPVWTGSTSPKAAVQDLQAQRGRVIEQADISPGGYVARHKTRPPAFADA